MKKTIKDTQDFRALYLRALADYQNLEKRQQSNQSQFIKYANEALLDKLLPLLDDLTRAQDHLKDPGLALVIDQFHKTFQSEGVQEIDALHRPFNPEIMDCTAIVEGKKDQVISVLTPGYLYHDKVLRPARVEVGSGSKSNNN